MKKFILLKITHNLNSVIIKYLPYAHLNLQIYYMWVIPMEMSQFRSLLLKIKKKGQDKYETTTFTFTVRICLFLICQKLN